MKRVQSHELRLIGGQWKRSKLPVVDTPGLRPTPDRVRETLFNWLGQDLTGWRCLDAFAGSGALGFEAASRGASEVLLLERDIALVRSLQASQQRLKASTVQVRQAEALAWMRRAEAARFELVFIDPPFGSGLQEGAIAAAQRLLVQDGWMYVEAPQAYQPEAPGLTLHRSARAGAVYFHLLRVNCPP